MSAQITSPRRSRRAPGLPCGLAALAPKSTSACASVAPASAQQVVDALGVHGELDVALAELVEHLRHHALDDADGVADALDLGGVLRLAQRHQDAPGGPQLLPAAVSARRAAVDEVVLLDADGRAVAERGEDVGHAVGRRRVDDAPKLARDVGDGLDSRSARRSSGGRGRARRRRRGARAGCSRTR